MPNDSRYKLTKISVDRYKITMNLDIGIYQYKFTRGSWACVETSVTGSMISNRNLIVNQVISQIVKISIYNWDDMSGRHTASGNVLFLDRHFPYPHFNNTKRIWIYLPPDYFTSNNFYEVFFLISF